MTPPRSVAVIGAGMAGLTCATALQLAVPEVRVFEAGFRAGGRMSCHREGGFEFDDGLPYFSAADERFRFSLEHWLEEGLVAEWQGWFVDLEAGGFLRREQAAPWFVGVPNMAALARHLAALCAVEYGCRVSALERTGEGWLLRDRFRRELGRFDQVLLAVPPPAARALLDGAHAAWAARLAGLETTRTWVLLLGFDRRQDLFFDAAYVSASPINWMARNSSKPGRGQRESWVVEATPEWTARFDHHRPEEIEALLFEAMAAAAGTRLDPPRVRRLHAWPVSRAIGVLGEPCLHDAEAGLGLCGDWCLGTTVEAAFLSGLALAEAVGGEVLPA